jgi:hypothetical protein
MSYVLGCNSFSCIYCDLGMLTFQDSMCVCVCMYAYARQNAVCSINIVYFTAHIVFMS